MAQAGAGSIVFSPSVIGPRVLVLLDFDETLIYIKAGSEEIPSRFILNEKVIDSIRELQASCPDIKIDICIFTARQYLSGQFTHLQDYLMRVLDPSRMKTHEQIVAECLTINKVKAEITRATGLDVLVASAYDCDYVGEYYKEVLYPGECIDGFVLFEYFKDVIEANPDFRAELTDCLLKFKIPKEYKKDNNFPSYVISILKKYLAKRKESLATDFAEKREIAKIEAILEAIAKNFFDPGTAYKNDHNFQKAEELCEKRGIAEPAHTKVLMLLQVLQHLYGIDSPKHPNLELLTISLHEDSDTVKRKLKACTHPIISAACRRIIIFNEPHCPIACYQEAYSIQLNRLFKRDLIPWVSLPKFIYFSDKGGSATSPKAALSVMSALRISGSEEFKGVEGSRSKSDETLACT